MLDYQCKLHLLYSKNMIILKSWLRYICHIINDLQSYINEYTYRFNKHFMKASIFDNLSLRMLNKKPYYLCV